MNFLGYDVDIMTTLCLLLFMGAMGKSAQFLLHTWLPDAMEGPTPVSAMIHAATMVSAGVFLLLRFFPLLQATGEGSAVFVVIGLIGAITAFLGATIAVAQYDIKRVLAFSTISQLGFMVAAVGAGAYIAAAFHLLTHAFFKALLFLGSGSVIHGVEHGHHHQHSRQDSAPAQHADEHAQDSGLSTPDSFDPQDIRNMGGLRKKMPITFWTFLIGGLALSGFPFITSGFWSKDEIFADLYHGAATGGLLAAVIFIVLVLSALLTAFYTARQIAMTFFGQPRTEAAAHAVESGAWMTAPLIVLAAFALLLGFANIPKDFPILGPLFGGVAYWLKNLLARGLLEKPEALEFNFVPVTLSVVLSLLGLGIGFLVYRGRRLAAGQVDPVEKMGGLFTFLHRRWYFDELYRAIFINPMQWIADNYTRLVDRGVIDRILEGGYKAGGLVAQGFKVFDRVVVTGASDAVGSLFRWLGREGRELQTGQVQNYLLSGLIAAVVLLVFFLFLAR